MNLRTLALGGGSLAKSIKAQLDGKYVEASVNVESGKTVVHFAKPLELSQGSKISVTLKR